MPFEKRQIVDVTYSYVTLFISSNEVKPGVADNKLDPSEKFLTFINYYSDFHRLIR